MRDVQSTVAQLDVTTGAAPQNALDFDGSSGFVRLNSHVANLDFDAPATIEFWYNSGPNDHKSVGSVLFSLTAGSSFPNFYVGYGTTSAGMTNERISVITSQSGSDVTMFGFEDAGSYINEWHHYAIVADGSQYLFYIDGEQVTTFGSTWPNNYPGDFGEGLVATTATIGAFDDGASNFVFGSLEDFRIWNTVRTQEQIAANAYNSTISDP